MNTQANDVFSYVFERYKNIINPTKLSTREKLFVWGKVIFCLFIGLLVCMIQQKRTWNYLSVMVLLLLFIFSFFSFILPLANLVMKVKKRKKEENTENNSLEKTNQIITNFDNRISSLQANLEEMKLSSLKASMCSKPSLNYLISACDCIINPSSAIKKYLLPVVTFFFGIFTSVFKDALTSYLSDLSISNYDKMMSIAYLLSIIFSSIFLGYTALFIMQTIREELGKTSDKKVAFLLKDDLVFIRDTLEAK